eukprot:722824-Lingulodinium_polyedra.AAC.1
MAAHGWRVAANEAANTTDVAAGKAGPLCTSGGTLVAAPSSVALQPPYDLGTWDLSPPEHPGRATVAYADVLGG